VNPVPSPRIDRTGVRATRSDMALAGATEPGATGGVPSGLSTAEATRLLAQVGPNTVAPPRRAPVAIRILRQLTDPLILLLIAAAVITTILGDITDTAVIVLVVVVNTTIGLIQEIRADRAINELNRLAAPVARVRRDGVDMVIPAAEVVPGDLVLLDAGDIVPADLTLHDARQLRLDESALTGESLPVDHVAGDEISSGTVVVAGRGVGVVERTGAASALGRLTALVAGTRAGPTPLQRRLARLGRLLGAVAVLLSAVVLLIGLAGGQELVPMVIIAVSLVVAAVPESLPAVVTLALALGAYRMARHHAIARRLHAVETLGSVTVVATDKTGTVTQNRMAVEQVVLPEAIYRVTGQGYDPTGQVIDPDGQPVTPTPELIELARAGLLCNDATLTPPHGDQPDWTAVGDPLEAALVVLAARCGLDPERERAAYPRVAERPFDAARRRMSTVHTTPAGETLVVCKGAPEVLLHPDMLTPSSAGAETLERFRAEAERLAGRGLRVLAIAVAYPDRVPHDDEDPETNLRLLGLVAIGDPIRAEAPGVAAAFGQAGIRLILITGDHPATAATIAGQLGIWNPGEKVVRGDTGSVARADSRVYARIKPEQKLDIVRALQEQGHVVAMTGDGVNDAPALRRADIGVAMGRSGTEVARQASDLILVDDNLGTVATAVEEGRRVYDNIRRFLHYALAGGFAEVLVMLFGPLLGLAVPLLPAQILWINLLTHGLPGVALGAEPVAADTMRRPPRPPRESVLGAGLLQAVLAAGVLLMAVSLAVGWWAYRADAPWQTMVFVTLGLAQLGLGVAVRAPRRRGHRGNPLLGVAIALSVALQLAAVWLSPLRTLLHTDPLSLSELAICVGAAILPGLTVTLWRRVRGAQHV